jgi:hypothetical protein
LYASALASPPSAVAAATAWRARVPLLVKLAVALPLEA